MSKHRNYTIEAQIMRRGFIARKSTFDAENRDTKWPRSLVQFSNYMTDKNGQMHFCKNREKERKEEREIEIISTMKE